MNDQFDELAKGMAQSVTRRGALKKFGVGLAGLALAALGLPKRASASHPCTSTADCPTKKGDICYQGRCLSTCDCSQPYGGCNPQSYACIQRCGPFCN